MSISAQRIVFKDDIDALLSAVAWIGSPGNRDPWEIAPAPEAERESFAMSRKLSTFSRDKSEHQYNSAPEMCQ